MIFKKLSLTFAALSMTLAASGCSIWVDGPYTYQNCYYDFWGYYVCETYYYNGDGTQDTSRDMITDLAQAEEEMLQNQGKHYAQKFALSTEQGVKIAKTINDFNALQSRSEQDVADFAQRLYGVNPSKIVSAVGAAQAGQPDQLNEVVADAAKNFGTTTDNMKSIVKTLHGKLLEQQGIRL